MISFRLKSVDLLFSEARAVLIRFPYPLLLSLGLGAYAIWLAGPDKSDEALWRFLLAGSLGIPLFMAIAISRERPPGKIIEHGLWLNPAASAAIAVFAYLAFLDGTDSCYVRCLHVGFIALLLVTFAGFLGGTREGEFWNFNKSLVLRGILSGIYALAFFLGAVLLVSSVNYLFELKLSNRIYPRMWFFSAYVIFIWHFLAGIPGRNGTDGKAEHPEALRIFAQYMLVPLVLLYGLVLYAYMAKILIEWDWPRGLVAWMVTAMAAAGIMSVLVTYPFQRKKGMAWLAGYGRLFFLAIIPLACMQLLAAARRISEYGITERRYFIVGLGFWVLGVSVYFLISRSKNIRLIPISASIMALLALAGPWSAYSVSLASQLGRLKFQLAENGLLGPEGLRKPDGEIPWETRRKISELTHYLIRNYGPRSLASLGLSQAAETSKEFPPHKAAARAMDAMGLQYVGAREREFAGRCNYRARQGRAGFLQVEGYSRLYSTGRDLQVEFELRGAVYRAWLDEGTGDFVVGSGDREAYRGSLKPLVQRAHAQCGTLRCDDIGREILSLGGGFDGLDFKLYLDELGGDMKGQTVKIYIAEGSLLIKD